MWLERNVLPEDLITTRSWIYNRCKISFRPTVSPRVQSARTLRWGHLPHCRESPRRLHQGVPLCGHMDSFCCPFLARPRSNKERVLSKLSKINIILDDIRFIWVLCSSHLQSCQRQAASIIRSFRLWDYQSGFVLNCSGQRFGRNFYVLPAASLYPFNWVWDRL